MIKPGKARYKILEEDNSLYITFTNKPKLAQLWHLVFSFIVFAGVIITIVVQTLSDHYFQVDGIQVLFSLFVFFFFLRVFYKNYCQLFGREWIVLDIETLKIISSCLKKSHEKVFDINSISNLRSGSSGGANDKNILNKVSNASNVVKFDYGADTYSFGKNLTESEVNDLIQRINRFSPLSQSLDLDTEELSIQELRSSGDKAAKEKSDKNINLSDLLKH